MPRLLAVLQQSLIVGEGLGAIGAAEVEGQFPHGLFHLLLLLLLLLGRLRSPLVPLGLGHHLQRNAIRPPFDHRHGLAPRAGGAAIPTSHERNAIRARRPAFATASCATTSDGKSLQRQTGHRPGTEKDAVLKENDAAPFLQILLQRSFLLLGQSRLRVRAVLLPPLSGQQALLLVEHAEIKERLPRRPRIDRLARLADGVDAVDVEAEVGGQVGVDQVGEGFGGAGGGGAASSSSSAKFAASAPSSSSSAASPSALMAGFASSAASSAASSTSSSASSASSAASSGHFDTT
mmetsp:Transcript_5089/g.10881  ORF Transcript_5089/g.10881 Transcript_5089/m.10881 type:complete len:292 (-) Transcript_5089:101-976(-)